MGMCIRLKARKVSSMMIVDRWLTDPVSYAIMVVELREEAEAIEEEDGDV